MSNYNPYYKNYYSPSSFVRVRSRVWLPRKKIQAFATPDKPVSWECVCLMLKSRCVRQACHSGLKTENVRAGRMNLCRMIPWIRVRALRLRRSQTLEVSEFCRLAGYKGYRSWHGMYAPLRIGSALSALHEKKPTVCGQAFSVQLCSLCRCAHRRGIQLLGV